MTDTNLRREKISRRLASPRQAGTVFIVDDHEATGQSLELLLTGTGYSVAIWSCAADALAQCDPAAPGCYLLDFHLPDMDGLELQRQLLARGCRHPFLVISGHGDVSVAVEALQQGAVDFLEKPFDATRLLDRIGTAMQVDAESRGVYEAIASLTDRERQLLPMIAEGQLSKAIAKALAISPRTVEVHRRNIMLKMNADTVAQLVHALTKHFVEQN